MAPTFVATSATPGWELGLWSQTSDMAWEERKQGTTEAYTFEAVDAPKAPGSRTLQLRMAGGGTEALLLDNSVQIFVDGQYSGEFLGHWEDPALEAGAPQVPQSPQAPQAPMAPPVPGRRSNEMTPVVSPTGLKSAPPPRPGPAPAAYPAAGPGRAQAPAAAPGYAQAPGPGPAPAPPAARGPPPPQVPARPQKAANLNTSPVAVQSLVEAARRGKSKDVQKLLGESVDPDGKGQGGITPLMAAAQFGSVPSVEALIGAGADPNIGKDGTNPMTIAFQQGHKEVLNVLFKSTFQNLDSMVAPPPAAATGGHTAMNGYAEPAGDEVPASAILDLREVTAKLSDVGKPRPRSAVAAQQSPTGQDAPPDEEAEDQQAHEGKVREDAVKDAMKLIARQK